jgi:hypothetical protein
MGIMEMNPATGFFIVTFYHMMGGMARVVSYDTPRDPRMEEFPVSKIIEETDKWYSWDDRCGFTYNRI